MDPATGSGVVVIAAVVVVVGIGAYFLLKHYCRLVVTAPPATIAIYTSASITATLQRKSWALGTWTNVVPASYSASGGSYAGAAATGTPTTAAAPSATVTITGAAVGTDTITISASGADCNVSLTVGATIV
jgi:hypothetical protein